MGTESNVLGTESNVLGTESNVLGSQFLSHQKISVTTKDTAELNVKHVKHNVITTKSIKMALVNICTCRFVYSVAIFVTMVTIQLLIFYLICTWAVVHTNIIIL